MSWFVYIIYSEESDIYYKGESETPYDRLTAHNAGLSVFTKGKGPWKLVFLQELADRSAALKREKQIKKLNLRSIHILINSELNLIRKNR